jgi:hypothetical protein
MAVPVNTVAPSIAGNTTIGSTLTGSDGTWTGAISITHQWTRNGVALAGETGSSHVVVHADQGGPVAFKITATNASGSTFTSAAVSIPAAVPLTLTANTAGALTLTADSPGSLTLGPN